MELELRERPSPSPIGEPTAEGAIASSAVRSLGLGLASSGAYGLALAVRDGPLAMAAHAAATVVVVGAAALLCAPPVWVAIAHADLPLANGRLLTAAARAIEHIGLTLAGLSPSVALLAVTAESAAAAAVFGWLGLVLATVLGLRSFGRDLSAALPGTSRIWLGAFRLATAAFVLLAVGRLAFMLLPALLHVIEVLP